MKNKLLWKILLVLGISFFVIPIVVGIYKINLESWTFIDWIIMYSFIYWPTYIIGLVLIILSIFKLK